MTYISKEGLDNLSKYKYVSGGYTDLDTMMNPWWEFVVTLVPIVKSQLFKIIKIIYK